MSSATPISTNCAVANARKGVTRVEPFNGRSMTQRRIAPFDVDAERALIGAGVLNRSAAEHVAAVRLDDWTTSEHRAIATAFRTLLADDVAPDPVLAADRSGVELAAIHDMFANTPAISAAPHYAEIVTRLGRRRRIVHRASTLSDAALDGKPDDVLVSLFDDLATEMST